MSPETDLGLSVTLWPFNIGTEIWLEIANTII